MNPCVSLPSTTMRIIIGLALTGPLAMRMLG
jgi:hypothetical protein